MIRTVVGRVQRVSVTGAFVEVDGWHLPMDDVLRVARATEADKAEYAAALEVAMREARAAGVPLG